MISLIDVKHKCMEGRFFPYDDWRDKLFVPPAVFLVWVFVNLGWSGNSVSWLSGIVTILGGMLIATNNKILILFGASSYMFYYLLDYVDGGVARYRKEEGIAGQYIDWIMHSVSAISISTGIFIGVLNNTHTLWIIPFGFLFILSSSLQLDRFSLGWWAICMYRQQNKSSNKVKSENCFVLMRDEAKKKSEPFLWRTIKIISTVIFHENYAIFVFPILAILNIFISSVNFPDFRLVLTVLGGTIYFSFVVHEIVSVTNNKKLETAYNKLFYSTKAPDLPAEHFFN